MCNLFFLYFKIFPQTEGEKKPAISKARMSPKTKIISLKKKKRDNLFCLAHLNKQKTCVFFVTKKKKIHNLGLP